MRSQTLTIYEVTTLSIGSLNVIRQREPFTVYFSNLTKAVDNLKSQLALNGWPPKVNYTAVYRSLKQRGWYQCDFDVAGARVLRVRVVSQTLNPALTTLGIDEKPTEAPRRS